MTDIKTFSNPHFEYDSSPILDIGSNNDNNNNSPLIDDNIPKIESKNWGLYILGILFFIYILFGFFMYHDIYVKIGSMQTNIETIQMEQLHRTDRVYNRTRDRFYRHDFKDWLVLFEQKNPELFVPKIPDVSPHEM